MAPFCHLHAYQFFNASVAAAFNGLASRPVGASSTA